MGGHALGILSSSSILVAKLYVDSARRKNLSFGAMMPLAIRICSLKIECVALVEKLKF